MKRCSRCGFPLGTRPGLLEKYGVCQACINNDSKKDINFRGRQHWLTEYIKQNRHNSEYDCVIAISGGKDSHCIVKRLIENHGVIRPLLVSVTDEFTHTKAGIHNLNNLVTRYNLDLLTWRCQPQTFRDNTKQDFFNELHPLKWIERKIYEIPVEIARRLGISLIFYGENPEFEYGTSETLNISRKIDDNTEIIYMGAIYPYSISDSLIEARSIGFVDLDFYDEWIRQGSIDRFAQIDSKGYLIQLWTKFVKFGFQRVTDIATRYVREGKLTREKALHIIDQFDYICDPEAKDDFCKCIDITSDEFDVAVDKHANLDIVEKRDGVWRLKF